MFGGVTPAACEFETAAKPSPSVRTATANVVFTMTHLRQKALLWQPSESSCTLEISSVANPAIIANFRPFACEASHIEENFLQCGPADGLQRAGPGAGPVLKTVSTATCGDRDLSAPPFHGRLTGRGPAPAGNRAVRLKRMDIVRSVFRHYGRSTRQEPGARSKRDGWATIGDQDLGLPPVSRTTADTAVRAS